MGLVPRLDHARERYNRPAWLHGITEPCGVGGMAVLAVKLTDTGLGEYWDDVDYIMRNHLSAQQIIDLEGMRKITGGTQHDVLLQRFRCGFAAGDPTAIQTHDIRRVPYDQWCSRILLRLAWHITRFNQGAAQVNLFLNRVTLDGYQKLSAL